MNKEEIKTTVIYAFMIGCFLISAYILITKIL